jgi:hypothetical protein
MSAETVGKQWAEFDDLASKSENEDVQFLTRAIKLHAEVVNSRLGALKALARTVAKNPVTQSETVGTATVQTPRCRMCECELTP